MSECFGTATGVQSKHDALSSMAILYFFRHTAREVIEATLLANISAKMVCHMVYPHQSKRTTLFNYNVLTHNVMGKVVPRGGVCSLP